MTLRNRLLSILAVPLAVILASTAVEVARQGRHLATLGDTARSVRLATGIGGLVHELQKERGLSAGFLASGGAQFGPELAAQRQAADAREQALRATLPPGGAGLPQDLRTALHHLEGRPALRQQVDGKQVKVRQAFTDFTEDIDALLDSADELARGADDADLVRRASAYLALLRAKEQVGRERATLNAVFAADRFDAEAYRRLLTILSAQEVHLASFLAQAGEAAHQAYQAALGGGQFDEAASLRKLALDRSEQGGFGVEPRRWFAAVTARIEAFKTVEDGLVADLEASLEAGRAAAWRGLLLYALVLAVGAGAAVALALRMVRIVLRQVGGEPDEVCRLAGALAEGNLHQDTGAPAPRGSVLEATQLLVARLGTVLSQVRGALDGLASGDLPPPLAEPFPGDLDVMRERLNACIATLRGLEADTTSLAEAAVVGRLEVRADAARHGGAYRRIVEGVNQTIGTLVGHLDAIPAPALIIDPDRKVRYLNAAGRALVGNKTAEEVIGQPCGGLLRTGDCTEERCVCLTAMRTGHTEVSETPGRPGDQVVELRHAGVPMRDGRGRVTGAFEVFADQTDVKRAAERAGKVAAYQAAEAQRLVGALQAFSRGDFSRQVEVAEGDQDTAEVVATYRQISAALASSAAAVQALVADLRALAAAGVAGQLKERVPAARHQGDFRAVAEGVNRTLDAALAPVDEAAGILERLAARDLTVRVAGQYAGDHDRIKAAVNQTAGALQDALRQVAEAAAQVSDASSQIASSSQAVASGASTQAASIQETGRSLEAVSQVSGANAQRAAKASGLAGEAAGAARQGAVTVEKAQTTMARMRASAEGTAQIIRDINGIAFQTNLLALNAAVEAARAGDAGRGFAVVAEEVRSLAARSREAAAKTEALIQDSVRSAEEGEAVTRELAASFAGISAGVQAVTGIVREISETAREEAGGLGRVSGAVEDMDRVTQQNAASAEQSSSAAAQLSAQAEELAGMVASFRLEARGGRA